MNVLSSLQVFLKRTVLTKRLSKAPEMLLYSEFYDKRTLLQKCALLNL